MDIRKLLGKLDQLNEGTMAQAKAKPTGPKFGKGKWKGTDPASAAKDKYVGGESILRDLEAKLNEDPVKRDLSKEFRAFKEAYDHNAPFNAADFNRHMDALRAREELRKTDPMRALVGDLIDKEHEKERLAKRKPADDVSMSTSDPRHPQYAYTQAGHQGVAEGYGEDDGIYIGAKVYHKEHQSGEPFEVVKILDDQRVGVVDEYGNKKAMFIDKLVPAQQGVAEESQPTKYRATVEYGPTAADAHFVTVTANSTEEAEAKVEAWCKKKGVRNPMITINGADKPVDEGWKDKLAGGAMAIGALGGIGALQNVAPNVTVQGHQFQLANPGTQPADAKLVTTDDGKKVYVWKTTGHKNRVSWSYRPAEQVKEQEVEESPEEALKYATQAHAGQTRSGGDPYISHPVRVANHIRQYKQSHNLDALISAAYLHDTIEDTDTTQEVLHDLFGGLVASLVKELTSDPEQIKKMGKAAYLSHKMAVMSSYALVIKLADRLDNVKDITTARTPQWRAKYAAETNQILNYIEKNRALSGTHNKLISLIRAKLAEINQPQQGLPEGFSDLDLAVMEGGHELVKEAPVAPVQPGAAPAPAAGKPTLGADLTKPAAQQNAQQQQQDQKAQQLAAQKEKQEQATLTKGVNDLKSAGAAVSNPNQVVKAFDKAEDNAGLTPADKNSIASAGTVLAPIMANPQLQGKFKDLVTQASAAQKKEQQQQANQPQPAVGAPAAGQVK